MVKKNKSERSQDFKADMQTIKKEDVRKLQETFIQVFGKSSDEMKEHSSKLKNKIYFFWFCGDYFFCFGILFYEECEFCGNVNKLSHIS